MAFCEEGLKILDELPAMEENKKLRLRNTDTDLPAIAEYEARRK